MSGDDDNGVVYGDEFITKLQLLWGEGFLSPGGPAEVAELFRGFDLAGAGVLDIGSGLGAMDRILVRDLGAARVLGVDIEAPLIERATAAARSEGLADRVSYRLVAPGPLPFPDGGFDIVTSKDAIICIEDKRALFAEAARVLKPGGRLVVGDWMCGAPPHSDEFFAWKDTAPGHYFLETIDNTARLLESLGLTEIETRDRNAWYRDLAREEVAQITGPKHAQVLALFGEEAARHWITRVEKKAAAVKKGDLRPGHIRARKPG